MSEAFHYTGNELEIFQQAQHWKKYFSKKIKPFIGQQVLEAGAGIGATTLLLNDGTASNWTLLEPDGDMAKLLTEKIRRGELPGNGVVHHATIDSLDGSFDTIIYIDVLEHIKNDKEELEKAASRLAKGGHLIVLSPAFQHLFSPFDKAIGHYRRYTRKTLNALTASALHPVYMKYFDSAGYFASLANRIFLKQKMPSLKQVKTWDNFLVPLSRVTDPLFFHTFGKSIIAVWKK